MEKLMENLKKILEREEFLDKEILIIQEDLQRAKDEDDVNNISAYEEYLSELKEEKEHLKEEKDNLIEERGKELAEREETIKNDIKIAKEDLQRAKDEDNVNNISAYEEYLSGLEEDLIKIQEEMKELKDIDFDKIMEEMEKEKAEEKRRNDPERRELQYLRSLLDDPDLDPSDMPSQNRQAILNRIAELEEKLSNKEEKPEKDNVEKKDKEDKTDKENSESSQYNKILEEYNKMVEIYKEDLEALYKLQKQYEKGEVDYEKYEKHADYMVGRYKFMQDAYKSVMDLYNNKNQNKFAGLTNEELEQKLNELNEELTDEWNFKAHQENGMEGYEEYEIDKDLKEIQEEIDRRKKEKPDEKPEQVDQPMMILEDKNQVKNSPQPTMTPKPEPKTFNIILHDIEAAKNAMSDAEVGRYESAKGKWLVPVQYDKGDWLRNSARFLVKFLLGSIVNVPRKIYSKIRTGKKQNEKMNNITENVNGLSDEEFDILVHGLQTHKGHESLVSASVRKAVLERAKRETAQENANRNIEIHQSLEEIKKSYDRSKQISEELKNDSLSNEERSELETEKVLIDFISASKVREVEKMREKGSIAQGGAGLHGLEEEDKAAREGSNIRGRKSGKRYSKNEKLEAIEAQLDQQQITAKENGDNFAEVEAFVKHEELLENNTFTKKIMGITVSKGDRNHATGVFVKEYKEDDLAKNIATIAAVTATTINMVKQIQNQALINQKNAEITQANMDNQAMTAKGEELRQDILNNQQTINDGIAATNDTRTGAAWSAGHEHAGAVNNFTNNWGSSTEDIAFHQIMSGTVDDNTLKNFITNGLDGIKKYAAANPNYDYTALVNALTNLGNGGVEAIAKYNNAMQTLVQNAVETGKIASTSVGAMNLSPTYIETMIPLVLAGKEVTSKEYRKAEKRVARKEKREQNELRKNIKVKQKDLKANNNKSQDEQKSLDNQSMQEQTIEENTNEGEEIEV